MCRRFGAPWKDAEMKGTALYNIHKALKAAARVPEEGLLRELLSSGDPARAPGAGVGG